MKKTIVGFFLFTLIAVPSLQSFARLINTQTETAFFQNNPRRGNALDFDKLKVDLNLSDEQVTDWKGLNDAYSQKYLALRENSNLDTDQRREQMRVLRTEQNQKLEKILDKDQYKKYRETMQQNMRERRRNNG